MSSVVRLDYYKITRSVGMNRFVGLVIYVWLDRGGKIPLCRSRPTGVRENTCIILDQY